MSQESAGTFRHSHPGGSLGGLTGVVALVLGGGLDSTSDANGAVVGTWELFDRVFQGTTSPGELEESSPDNYKSRVWVCIANLRKKIGSDEESDYIQTVHGIGYRFRREPSR